MPLANYSTTVAHTKTATEIIGMLRKHGVRRVIEDTDGDGNVIALQFVIETATGTPSFKLPVNVESCRATLQRQRDFGEISGPVAVSTERARNVAWRIVKDWIRAQIGLIETGMVVMEEVFMPYLMLDERTSIFEALRDGRLPQLESGRAPTVEVEG